MVNYTDIPIKTFVVTIIKDVIYQAECGAEIIKEIRLLYYARVYKISIGPGVLNCGIFIQWVNVSRWKISPGLPVLWEHMALWWET